MSDRPRLALHGGEPVRPTLLPYARQEITEEDILSVAGALRGDWLTQGPGVEAFENALAETTGSRHVVAFSSGTAALHAAVFAAGLGPGDEAVVPPLTFCATANCLVYQGATPVFADVREDTLCLDPEEARRRITPRTKAILAVDYAGHPADLEALGELARERGLLLVEDACHSLGARLHGRPVGTLADLTVLSFHPVKHITTGEGGAVATGSEDLARRLRLFRSHGIARDPRQREAGRSWEYDMTELGYNYRIPDVACALGLSQLRRLDANLARRRELAAAYLRELAGEPGLRLPTVLPGAEPAWHLFPVRLVPERLRADRAGIFAALRAENLGVNVHYRPVHLLSWYRERFGHGPGLCPVAEAAYGTLLSLPMFHAMTDRDLSDVLAGVRKVLAHYAA